MGVGKFQTAICGIVEMRLYYIKSPPSIVYLYINMHIERVCGARWGKVSSTRRVTLSTVFTRHRHALNIIYFIFIFTLETSYLWRIYELYGARDGFKFFRSTSSSPWRRIFTTVELGGGRVDICRLIFFKLTNNCVLSTRRGTMQYQVRVPS